MKVIGKKLLAISGCILVVASLILLNIRASETSSTKIYVDPPTIMALYDADFTINISVQDVVDVYAWQARLIWDPNLLEFVAAIGGAVYNQTEGWAFLCNKGINIIDGGTLISVIFHCENLGGCTLELKDTKIFDSTPIEVPAPPNLGDVNGDLRVNVLDMVGKAFLTSPGDPGWNPDADFNKDDVIDMFDVLCVEFNWGRVYPAPTARMPEEIAHTVDEGYVTNYSPSTWDVAWKWLDSHDPPNEVWLSANVTVSSGCPILNFDFNRTLGIISFDLASSTSGYCNVSIPKPLMDGAFKVLIDGRQVASKLTWNTTRTFICFTHDQGTHKITIIGEFITRIRAPDLIKIADVDGNGNVTIIDISAVAVRYRWKQDP